MTRPWAQAPGIHITSLNGDDDNGNKDNKQQRRRSHRQGLVHMGMTHKPLCASTHATHQTQTPLCASAPGFQPSCTSAQATVSHIDATIKSTGDIKHRCLKSQIHRQTYMTATFPMSNIDVVMGPDKLFCCRVRPQDRQHKQPFDNQSDRLIRATKGVRAYP